MNNWLKRDLEELTGAYYEEVPGDAEYPYAVFSLRRLAESEGRQDYSMEINVWDQHQYYSRAESLMDALEKKLHRHNFSTGHFLIRIFKGSRQNVSDPDKTLKRVREQFELHVFEKSD